MDTYYVYILASIQRTLYIGFTGDLHRRLHQHKTGAIGGFTRRYRVNRLVHLESYTDVRDAQAREHQLKSWVRRKKIALIEAENPEWEDLADTILPLSAMEPAGGDCAGPDAPSQGRRDPSVARLVPGTG
jgi:putative endonuclease